MRIIHPVRSHRRSVTSWCLLLPLLLVVVLVKLPLSVAFVVVPHRSLDGEMVLGKGHNNHMQQRQQQEHGRQLQSKQTIMSKLLLFQSKRDGTNGFNNENNNNKNKNKNMDVDSENLPPEQQQQQQRTAVGPTQRGVVVVIPIAFKFLASLWNGIMLPFPTLRNADNSPTFTLRECVIAIALYLSLGAVAYTSVFEKWSLVDALYFSVVSFSTVGYGDMCPTNLASKLFTCIFGLGGVAFLGIAIATIGSALVEAELEATKKLGVKRFMDRFDKNKKDKSNNNDNNNNNNNNNNMPQKFDSYRVPPSWKGLIPKFLPSLSLLFIGGGIMGQLEGWSWFDSVYYSFITAGTLGYGDFSPKTQFGRMLAVLFLPIAVASAGEILGTISKVLVTRRQHLRNEQLLHRELDLQFLQEMDADGNGRVSRFEYITFMLQAMGAVDMDLLAELNVQFDAMDESKDGSLGVEDLKLMARSSGMNVKS